jgi:choline dehydrogenase
MPLAPALPLILTLTLSAPVPAPLPEDASFDYVVVGAGAAGSVVAARLSEDEGASVLVLEAGGPDDDPRIARPSAYRELPGSALDWKHTTEEEPHLANRRIPWPRGKVWGGSGTISAMVYVRGPARDFDRWRALGNEGWGYEDVLPFFRKAENHEGGPSLHHGTGGPQNVADPRWVPPLSRAFLEAAREIGLPRSDDWNGASPEGAGLYPLNQKNGERHGASTAYLRPALVRRNLRVESHALATRVLVRGGRAEGVAFVQEGRARQARARREVILCAGTIGSPQLLLLSGIGPAEHLRALGIPLVADLPGVGANLQDHPRVALTWESKVSLGLSPSEQEEARRDWARDRTGPLTSPGLGAGAFVRTLPGLDAPDVQIIPVGNPVAGVFSLNVALMHPASRGSLRLRSADPSAAPLIRANYLAEAGDMEALVRGLAVARRLAAAKALAAFRGEARSPGEDAGDEALRRHVRESATTFFHPVGTCRMGNDAGAVVDHELRVRGVRALRVIDASVMPTLVGGATHAAAVMIGEKGALLVKDAGAREGRPADER